MEDQGIIELYWQRSEQAIQETDEKYGRYCFRIADNILGNREDAAESVNDTYLAAWRAMPPHRPGSLSAFLGKLTRRIAIDRWRVNGAKKRGGGQVQLALEELGDCVSQSPSVEEAAMEQVLCGAVNRFLEGLPQPERTVFLRRYFLLEPVKKIGPYFGFSEAKVTSMLHRTRKKLRTYLEKEGYV